MRAATRNPLPPEGKPAMPDSPLRDNGRATLVALEAHAAFERRHIGPDAADESAMLAALGYASRAALIDAVVPPAIRLREPLELNAPRHESEALANLLALAAKNRVFKSYIGQGYYGTLTPAVIQRHVPENPASHTAYTP